MPSTGTLLARGLGRRCPRCGSGALFTRWFRLAERCPRCRLEFQHEEGYWVGAMIVNIAVAELAFGVTFAAGLLITWPDVPWGLLTVVCVAVNAAVPLGLLPVVEDDLDGHRRRDESRPARVGRGPARPRGHAQIDSWGPSPVPRRGSPGGRTVLPG